MDLLRPYCSVSDVRTFIENDNGDDDVFKSAINRASRHIEAVCDRNFWYNDYSSSAYSVRRYAVMPTAVYLPFEIITLTELTVDDEVLVEGVEDDYYAEEGVNSRVINGTFTYPFTGTMRVKGTFGFALDTADPDNNPPPGLYGDLHDAAIRIAAVFSGLWKKTVRGFDGGNETSLVQTVDASTMRVLSKYKVNKAAASF